MRVRVRLGAMSGMTLGSTMCCPHLTDHCNLLAEAVPAKAIVPREQLTKHKPLKAAEVPGDIL
jgi:hypothetical protein